MTDKPADIIVGIDLGTTNSLVAYCDEKGPRVLNDSEGRAILPSVVRLSMADGSAEAIGHEARGTAIEYPERTVHSVKRLMGRGIKDAKESLAALPYRVVEGEHNTARVSIPGEVGDHVISPQAISAMILIELKQRAEAALGCEVRKAVVTVPAYFDDAQRQATRDAGRLAGLEVVRMVNEPTAAALAYGLGAAGASKDTSLIKDKSPGSISLSTKLNPEACSSESDLSSATDSSEAAQTIAVYDLGGGTFDISILRLEQTDNGAVDQVLSTAGDTQLGGDDVDQMIIKIVIDEIRGGYGKTLDFPPATQQALRNFAEAMKIQLSTEDYAMIAVDIGDGRIYERTLHRSEFEAMIKPWVDRTLDACKQALRGASLTVNDIDRVVLVGGSTRIPMVVEAVGRFFEAEPYTALDPDQVVALGASVQAARLAGIQQGGLLLDVIPLSLGIETMGGAVAKLITANSTIPARASEIFSTYAEGQTKVAINVYQGERELVQDCRLLGSFELTGIPPMPAGLPKLNVTFVVDANGVLTVTATEERSGRRARTQVVPNHGLTRDEVEAIERDSFQHAKADMDAHRLIDLRLNAKLDIRNIQKQLERVGDGIDADYRAEIDGHITKVESMIDSPDDTVDADAFQQAMHDMDHATIKLAEIAIAQTLKQDLNNSS
ncbi:MAG: Hsp70 family protein [Planctomycetota bacterium]